MRPEKFDPLHMLQMMFSTVWAKAEEKNNIKYHVMFQIKYFNINILSIIVQMILFYTYSYSCNPFNPDDMVRQEAKILPQEEVPLAPLP